jgi:alkylation response protein AidB-like acyl-CoA dehydrogenase
MRFSAGDDEFRRRVADWLAANVPPELRGVGGPGREHEAFPQRLAWNRRLAAAGWSCLGWPSAYGGHDATLGQQVIFHEEYARSAAPARVAVVGEELLGPTLIAFGTAEQRRRFLPPIAAVEELWCQGYSEPGAGSDLAAVATTAVRDGDQWVITGQKVWTSLAHVADWCFVLARTEPGSRRSAGLSYLLVPMRQPGITVRPIRQLTGTAEFNEVFFDGARTELRHVVGEPGDGWRIAMATLAFERGVGMLGQQVGFRRELGELVELARRTEAGADPLIRDRLARAWIGLEVLRAYALDTLGEPADAVGSAGTTGSAGAGVEPSVLKVLWSRWHQALGELAMDVRGAASMTGVSMAGTDTGDLDAWQRLFLFGRAETIYGGSDEIQRNIIATRALGLPRPARA